MKLFPVSSEEAPIALGGVMLLLVVSLTAACGGSPDELIALARAGSIHESAPVKAQVQMQIAASPARVWTLLVDVSSWPKWNHQIEKVTASGPLAPGTRFVWTTGGTRIQSQVQLLDPDRRLSWTGTAFTAKAIHVWELSPATDGQTLVTIKESMDGPFMAHLFPSRKLAETDTEWLVSLKHAAELQSK